MGSRNPGHPAAILGALTDEQRVEVREAAELLELASRWWESPTVARYWSLIAWSRRVRHHRAGGMTRDEARDEASAELGLKTSAMLSLLKRQRKASLEGKAREAARTKKGAFCPPRSRGRATTVADDE